MSVLGGIAPLANGAGVRIWSDPNPLCVAIVLINAAQSRKSQTTTLIRELGVILDEFGHAREREQMLKDLKPDADPNEIKYEALPSAVLEGFTPEAGAQTSSFLTIGFKQLAFFEAVSSDYCVKKSKNKICRPGGFGRLANIDEVYPAFLAFGLISGGEGPKHGASVNSHTSTLNRFLQTGSTSRLTRTAGAYGGVASLPVSFALLGNGHPATTLAMLEGATGIQVAATHENLVLHMS
eukprot:s696_g6.t1